MDHFCRALDNALASFESLQRGLIIMGTFTGNHALKCLKVGINIFSCFLLQAKCLLIYSKSISIFYACQLPPPLKSIVKTCYQKLVMQFNNFGKYLRCFLSVTQCIVEELTSLTRNWLIQVYCLKCKLRINRLKPFWNNYYCTMPGATIKPKVHMLEDHTVDFLRQWRVGFGMLSEQGAESIHTVFTSVEHTQTFTMALTG